MDEWQAKLAEIEHNAWQGLQGKLFGISNK